MHHSWALSAWLQVPVGLVLLLCGLLGPWVVVERAERVALLESGDLCPPGTAVEARDDCLVPVAGRVDDRRGGRGGSYRYHFAPADPSTPDGWVRFSGDETSDTGATGEVARGAPVTALYAGDDPVAFEVGGERVEATGSEAGSARLAVWASLWLASLGASMLVGAWWRRRDGPASHATGGVAGAPEAFPSRGRAGAVAMSLLVLMLASFTAVATAIAAGSLVAELTGFGLVTGLGMVLALLARRRRRLQRPHES